MSNSGPGDDATDGDGVSGDRTARLVAHLRTESAALPDQQRRERRATASAALARQARDDPATVAEHLPALVSALPEQRNASEVPDGAEVSNEVRDHLLRCIASVAATSPGAMAGEDVPDFTAAIGTDLSDGTLRTVAKALFRCASERPADFEPAVDTLGDLLTYDASTVRAWSVGALGQLCPQFPEAVAETVDGFRRCLGHDDDTVVHNAVEALGALVRERPDAVVPVAGDLRDCLDHDDEAIQHNAAGVLGHLATDYPEAVVPALEDLQALRDHENESVRRVATVAIARLARSTPDAEFEGAHSSDS